MKTFLYPPGLGVRCSCTAFLDGEIERDRSEWKAIEESSIEEHFSSGSQKDFVFPTTFRKRCGSTALHDAGAWQAAPLKYEGGLP